MDYTYCEGEDMNTDIREWIEEIWEYCQEHWIVALAAGVVLLVLLVSAVLILSAKRDDEEEEFEFSANSGLPEEAAAPKVVLPENAPAPAETPAPASEPVAGAAGVVENLLKNVETASGAAGQKVETIELKIEKAQLTIRYAGGERREETVEALEVEKVPEAEILREPEAEPEKKAEIIREDKEETQEEITAQPKKFGAENWNTARSGRVYTEEELFGQIID